MKHIQIYITGRVQGVSFRHYTCKQALALQLNGFVMNMPDGSVYIEAEGTPENVKKLTRWCRHGPTFAKVTDLRVEDGAMCNYADFTIRR